MTRPVTLVVNPAARKGATLRMIDPVTVLSAMHAESEAASASAAASWARPNAEEKSVSLVSAGSGGPASLAPSAPSAITSTRASVCVLCQQAAVET